MFSAEYFISGSFVYEVYVNLFFVYSFFFFSAVILNSFNLELVIWFCLVPFYSHFLISWMKIHSTFKIFFLSFSFYLYKFRKLIIFIVQHFHYNCVTVVWSIGLVSCLLRECLRLFIKVENVLDFNLPIYSQAFVNVRRLFWHWVWLWHVFYRKWCL